MRSSTSNSDIHLVRRTLPSGRWMLPFVVGMALLCLVIGALEVVLAARGFQPTVIDSPSLWSRERLRASELGSKALIMVGASRAQLDTDLGTLSAETGKDAVQLAIDGSSYLRVLADLAADDRVTGTVLVDSRTDVPGLSLQDAASSYVAYWRHEQEAGNRFDFTHAENALSSLRQGFLRSYADGAGPWTALVKRVLPAKATPQYLVTLPSRSRDADYSRVAMPGFYYQRAMRNAGIETLPPFPDIASLDRGLLERIRALPQAPADDFVENARVLAAMVRRIEDRGGRVIFVMFPRSGLVRAADDIRYPRTVFWDRMLPLVGGKGVYFADEPTLRDFTCPDGSHLDVRDKRRFTEALVEVLKSHGWIGKGS